MKFEFYVLNYNWKSRKAEMFNIFNNICVQERTEKIIKKYLRAPSRFECDESKTLYGFPALCEEIRRTIMWQEWARSEYEISVSDAFTYEIRDIVSELDEYDSLEYLKEKLIEISTRNPKLEKWDCYMQCEPNIRMITHEVIRQYKEQVKK